LSPPFEDAASRACCIVLPKAAKSAWRKLKKAAEGLCRSDPAEEFHEARKRAKRCRYTAELIAPLLGRQTARAASKFIRQTTKVQDALGEHQDALIAAEEFERARAEHAQDSKLAENASALLEDQGKRAESARARFFKIWSKLDRKKHRQWMRPRRESDLGLEEGLVAVRRNGSHI
jgi:CHAD domain-containing protein